MFWALGSLEAGLRFRFRGIYRLVSDDSNATVETLEAGPWQRRVGVASTPPRTRGALASCHENSETGSALGPRTSRISRDARSTMNSCLLLPQRVVCDLAAKRSASQYHTGSGIRESLPRTFGSCHRLSACNLTRFKTTESKSSRMSSSLEHMSIQPRKRPRTPQQQHE